jgi:hypothetical protein
MTAEQPALQPEGLADADVAPEQWADWCRAVTDTSEGKTLDLHFVDGALGDVHHAVAQPFVAIEHDQLGPSLALTVKYGSGVVPITYVIAEPTEVRQRLADDGAVDSLTITDRTGRRTTMILA